MARGGAALSVGASGARYAGDGGAAFSHARPEGTGDPASIRPACAAACRNCGTSPHPQTPTPTTVGQRKTPLQTCTSGTVVVPHPTYAEIQSLHTAHPSNTAPQPQK